MPDFSAITEQPASHLTAEQMARIEQRYRWGAQWAAGKRVLEVSCGAGIGLGRLASVAESLVGCDLTYSMVALTHQHYTHRVPLVCCDAQTLPFGAGSFDLLLSFEAIYYLPRLDCFLCEAHRLLSPAGHLLIATSNPDWPHFVPGAQSVFYPAVPALATGLQQAGFAQVQVWGALPSEESTNSRQRLIARVRRQSRAVAWLSADTRLSHWLKRLAYGSLIPLPAELPSHHAADPSHDLTPLDPTRHDYRHRVIFVSAQR
jgi:SAM-dependent methyltransferase